MIVLVKPVAYFALSKLILSEARRTELDLYFGAAHILPSLIRLSNPQVRKHSKKMKTIKNRPRPFVETSRRCPRCRLLRQFQRTQRSRPNRLSAMGTGVAGQKEAPTIDAKHFEHSFYGFTKSLRLNFCKERE